jgi:glycosyltransferase involved in cell wall biosynthesis
LANQLDSILGQSLPVGEIVIVDDLSTDATIDIVKTYQEKNPGLIKFEINKERLGPSKNFEKALGLCKGEVIFLSDQDDEWLPQKVQVMVAAFKKNSDLEALFTNGYLIDDKGKFLEGTLFERIGFTKKVQLKRRNTGMKRKLLRFENDITGATLAIRSNLLQRCVPFELPPELLHDYWLGLHAALADHIDWIDTPLIKYRIHPEQQVGLGRGVSLKKDAGSFQRYIQERYAFVCNQGKIINDLLKVYSSDALQDARLRNQQEILLFQLHRLKLPDNLLLRLVKVFKNIPRYKKSGRLTGKDLMKDIVKYVPQYY